MASLSTMSWSEPSRRLANLASIDRGARALDPQLHVAIVSNEGEFEKAFAALRAVAHRLSSYTAVA